MDGDLAFVRQKNGSRQCGVSDVAERMRASSETCVGVSGGIKHKGRKSVNWSYRKMKKASFLSTRSKILTNITRISTCCGGVKRTSMVNGCTLVKYRSGWAFAYFSCVSCVVVWRSTRTFRLRTKLATADQKARETCRPSVFTRGVCASSETLHFFAVQPTVSRCACTAGVRNKKRLTTHQRTLIHQLLIMITNKEQALIPMSSSRCIVGVGQTRDAPTLVTAQWSNSPTQHMTIHVRSVHLERTQDPNFSLGFAMSNGYFMMFSFGCGVNRVE